MNQSTTLPSSPPVQSSPDVSPTMTRPTVIIVMSEGEVDHYIVDDEHHGQVDVLFMDRGFEYSDLSIESQTTDTVTNFMGDGYNLSKGEKRRLASVMCKIEKSRKTA